MDKETVIKGCENWVNNHKGENFLLTYSSVVELLAVLKEQDATMVIESENMYTGLSITHCPKCGISLDRYLYGRQYEGQINYCPMCGQAVKWE